MIPLSLTWEGWNHRRTGGKVAELFRISGARLAVTTQTNEPAALDLSSPSSEGMRTGRQRE